MHSVLMDHDVTGVARLEISRLERTDLVSGLKTGIFRALVRVTPHRAIDFLARLVGTQMIKLIDRDVNRMRAYTLSFRGIRDELRNEIEFKDEYPEAAFLNAIEHLQRVLLRSRLRYEEAVVQLREVNPQSRYASAYSRLVTAVSNLYETVSHVRLIAIGAESNSSLTWDEDVALRRKEFLIATRNISASGADDIDPELLALAEQAVVASESRDPSCDPEWARRLSRSSFH